MLVPSEVHFILYPLERHAWVLPLEREELAERSKVRRLVGWWPRGIGVQYKMFTGDQGWESLVRHWQMLHCTGLDERACWELLTVAPWERLPGVDGETVRCHRGNGVRDWNGFLVHLVV